MIKNIASDSGIFFIYFKKVFSYFRILLDILFNIFINIVIQI